MSQVIGRVHYSPARGVQVREGQNLNEMHSAVSGTIAIYTDSFVQTKFLLDNWDQIIEAANTKAAEILSSVPNVEG